MTELSFFGDLDCLRRDGDSRHRYTTGIQAAVDVMKTILLNEILSIEKSRGRTVLLCEDWVKKLVRVFLP